MSQHTATTRAPESAARTQVEKDYVAEVATLWQELAHEGTSPSGSELAAALATRLGLPVGAAQGVLQGFQSLLHYALSEQAAGSTALEEERASVQVALATIRPVLAARLQQRLDEADARTPEVTCEQCRRRCEAQDGGGAPGSARWAHCPCGGATAGARAAGKGVPRRKPPSAYRPTR
jgi:hypothetical protein